MLLTEGEWSGRGRFLHHGQSLGVIVQTRFQLSHDHHGDFLEGTFSVEGGDQWTFTARAVTDETGLYELSFDGSFASRFAGTGKLESEPNMGLLWADSGAVFSFTLFRTGGGCGCRGFLRADERLLTWEMALKQAAPRPGKRSGNVVSLRPKR